MNLARCWNCTSLDRARRLGHLPRPDAEAAWKKYVPQGAEKGAPGTPVATPVFDGVRPETIKGLLSCTLPDRDGNKLVGPDGKATLFDGRTGERSRSRSPWATCTC